ncbi:MAG: fused MFS/spermidine synthase [Polyangiaceae bacterium]
MMKPVLRLWLLAVLFFLSGFSALAIELIFVKYLGYVFGTTAYAVSTVLAAFMLGLSLGNLLGGKLSSSVVHHLRWYGALEFAVGLYALAAPWLFRGLMQFVGHAGRIFAEGEHALALLTAMRFVFASVLVLPPTVAMGVSFPLLVRHLQNERHLERNIGRLYTVNTLGAAAGTLLCTYLVFAAFGLQGTLVFVACVNTSVLCGCRGLESGSRDGRTKLEPEEANREVSLESKSVATTLRFSTLFVYGLAFMSGFITLAYEVVVSHLLATVVGTSTYAFGLVLGIFLLALAIGGAIVSRYLSRLDERHVLVAVALALLGTGLSLSHSLSLWEKAGRVFELVGYFKPSFFGREATRACVVLWLIFVPSVLMGLLFPTALCLQRLDREASSRRVGKTYAINTLGTILGSTVTGFVLLESFGSQGTLRWLGAILTILALPAVMAFTSWSRRAAFVLLAVGILASFRWARPWDVAQMTTGANIYFAPGFDRASHKIVDFMEDVHGGMTTVTSDGQVRTLMTNGKFEGNTGPERLDQVLFAVVPNLFVRGRARALNIGIGTGQTLKVLHSFGYETVEAVDISPNVVKSARRWFEPVHRGVFDEPNVVVRYRDGRNHLLLTEDRYDLISIELTSIWFASAANLYSREFYELCRSRLRPNGIVQQWVQLHHIELRDIATILTTMKTVFPEVELWMGGHQGILIGGEHLAEPDLAAVTRGGVELERLVRSAGIDEPGALFSHRLIAKGQMDRVIARITADPSRIATDDSLVLEYSTPRGNGLDRAEADNLAAIRAAISGTAVVAR